MDLGFTQASLAARLGRTTRTVADWELGVCTPLTSSWISIATVLGEDLLPSGANIGSRLRSARWRLGLDQTQLAERLGLDPRTIRNVERGRYRPGPVTLAKLSAFLQGDS